MYAIESEDLEGDRAPIVRLVNMVLAEAVRTGESKISFERWGGEGLLMRRSGSEPNDEAAPETIALAVIMRLRNIAQLDFSDRENVQQADVLLVVADCDPVRMSVEVRPSPLGPEAVLNFSAP